MKGPEAESVAAGTVPQGAHGVAPFAGHDFEEAKGPEAESVAAGTVEQGAHGVAPFAGRDFEEAKGPEAESVAAGTVPQGARGVAPFAGRDFKEIGQKVRPANWASHSGDVDGDKDRREKDLLGKQQHEGGKNPAFDAESSSGSTDPNCLDSKTLNMLDSAMHYLILRVRHLIRKGREDNKTLKSELAQLKNAVGLDSRGTGQSTRPRRAAAVAATRMLTNAVNTRGCGNRGHFSKEQEEGAVNARDGCTGNGPSKRPRRAADAAADRVFTKASSARGAVNIHDGGDRGQSSTRLRHAAAVTADQRFTKPSAKGAVSTRDGGDEGQSSDKKQEEGGDGENGHGYLPVLLDAQLDASKSGGYRNEWRNTLVHHFQGRTTQLFDARQRKLFFKENEPKFPFELVEENKDGAFPDIFYTRDDLSTAYNGQWVMGWLVEKNGELLLQVLGASKEHAKVQTGLKNEKGLDSMVSDARQFYHGFKPVKLGKS